MASTVRMVMAGIDMKLLKEDWQILVSRQPAILERILSMCVSQGKRSPNGARYCFPGQSWLAEGFGVCRKTVNEALAWYEAHNLIISQWREPRHGMFRTKLYMFGALILKAIGAERAAVQALLYRVTSGLHISQKQRTNISNNDTKRSQTIKIKGPPGKMPWDTLFERRPELV